jgi:hypothetical protein
MNALRSAAEVRRQHRTGEYRLNLRSVASLLRLPASANSKCAANCEFGTHAKDRIRVGRSLYEARLAARARPSDALVPNVNILPRRQFNSWLNRNATISPPESRSIEQIINLVGPVVHKRRRRYLLSTFVAAKKLLLAIFDAIAVHELP